MQVLHLLHQYLPEHIGGVELYTQWLAQSLVKRGHQTSIFYRQTSPGATLTSSQEGQVQVWVAGTGSISPTRRFLATFREPALLDACEQVINRTRPDLIHIQHLMGQPAALFKIIGRRRIPYVITLHDFWWVCANAQLLTNYSQTLCDGPRLYLNCARCTLARGGYPQLLPALPILAPPLAWRNYLLRQILGAAERLIAPTEFVRQWYIAHGAPSDKTITIPHGLPLAGLISRPPGPVRKPFRLAYIGGLSFQKGVHVLLEAFAGLEDDVELWVVGDETAEPEYVTQLRGLASDRVRFLGKLNRAEVWKILAQVEVLVVPSLWFETFTFVISEAFAAGVPVIASRLGPLKDRIEDGVDGLLVPPGDPLALRRALQRLIRDQDLLPKLQAGIKPVDDIETHTTKIETIYRQVMAE